MFTTTVNAFAGYNIVATQGTVFGSSASLWVLGEPPLPSQES